MNCIISIKSFFFSYSIGTSRCVRLFKIKHYTFISRLKKDSMGRYVENDSWLRVCRSSFIFKPLNINIIYGKRSNSLTNNNSARKREREKDRASETEKDRESETDRENKESEWAWWDTTAVQLWVQIFKTFFSSSHLHIVCPRVCILI